MVKTVKSAGGGARSERALKNRNVTKPPQAGGFVASSPALSVSHASELVVGRSIAVPSPAANAPHFPVLPLRAGPLPVAVLIDLYMAHYAGRDTSRPQRLGWWREAIETLRLDEVSDDHVHAAVQSLAQQSSRYWAGTDADGRAIFKAKKKALAAATLNRYIASIGAVFTRAIKKRIAPKGWVHPCRAVERHAENNEVVRFLADDERERLLAACKACPWARMYLLTLQALTSGARKGELLAMRWRDLDIQRSIAYVGCSKNGDRDRDQI